MTDPTGQDQQTGQPEAGWRVLDPDGNVVDSGPGIVLIAAGESGPEDQASPASDETEES